MTLSAFLRDYLYIPLGGNRHGALARYRNMMVTMLLGGLWHGASWTFVLWGGLHGGYLVINHLWQAFKSRAGFENAPSLAGRIFGTALTFVAVVLAWVVFRAETIDGALGFLRGMSGANGFFLPSQVLSMLPGAGNIISATENMPLLGNATMMGVFEQLGLLACSMCICWLCPNTQAMSQRTRLGVLVLSFGFIVQAVLFGHEPSVFLYFQF
jgi:hypothetical protein